VRTTVRSDEQAKVSEWLSPEVHVHPFHFAFSDRFPDLPTSHAQNPNRTRQNLIFIKTCGALGPPASICQCPAVRSVLGTCNPGSQWTWKATKYMEPGQQSLLTDQRISPITESQARVRLSLQKVSGLQPRHWVPCGCRTVHETAMQRTGRLWEWPGCSVRKKTEQKKLAGFVSILRMSRRQNAQHGQMT
jgi:hypothetical protein